MNELALFAGAGGGILGGKLLGWRTVCAVERDAFPAQILAQRQNDGCLEPFPIWSDVCSFDGGTWRGIVDVVSGGFPCTDISSAGKKAGIEGEESGLWREMARIIGEVKPPFVFIENSPHLISRGLHRVLEDLCSPDVGPYECEWGIVGAHHAGAPHKRDRLWLVGYSHSNFQSNKPINDETQRLQDVAHSSSHRYGEGRGEPHLHQEDGRSLRELLSKPTGPGWWTDEPELGRVANGMAHRVDRLKAIGNGQVPAVAAMAWQILYRRLTEK